MSCLSIESIQILPKYYIETTMLYKLNISIRNTTTLISLYLGILIQFLKISDSAVMNFSPGIVTKLLPVADVFTL